MKVTIIGHSTVLIEAAGTKILTDPYFGTWGNLAYKRIAPPSETREGLCLLYTSPGTIQIGRAHV